MLRAQAHLQMVTEFLTGRYMPNEHLQYEFPADLESQVAEVESCASHSNLLLHEEVATPDAAQADQGPKVVRVEIMRDTPP